jgi:hypothetical protein
LTVRTARIVQGVLAGAGVVVVQLWPAVAAGWAGYSGSAGDLREVPILVFGAMWAVVLACLAGRMMVRALGNTAFDPTVGRLDPWAAYALALGTYGLAITALTALALVLLLTDEDLSLRSREALVLSGWAAGHVLAALGAHRAAVAALPTGALSPSAESDAH